jgi:hypothetical protein
MKDLRIRGDYSGNSAQSAWRWQSLIPNSPCSVQNVTPDRSLPGLKIESV